MFNQHDKPTWLQKAQRQGKELCTVPAERVPGAGGTVHLLQQAPMFLLGSQHMEMSYESPSLILWLLILAPTVWAATPDKSICMKFGRLRIKLY